MKKNKEYKQISVNDLNDYDCLKGKVVEKVAFSNRGCYDENLFIILFTDKTYVAVGADYNDDEHYSDEPKLDNYWVMDPQCCNGGDYNCHIYTDDKGNLRFDKWIQILKDFGIWELEMDEAQKIIAENKAKQEQREYEQYLRLKAKFEKNG